MISTTNQTLTEDAIRNKINAEGRISELRKKWEELTGKRYTTLKPSQIENEVFYNEEIERLSKVKPKVETVDYEDAQDDNKEKDKDEHLKELQENYFLKFDKEPAPAYKNNVEWLEKQLAETE